MLGVVLCGGQSLRMGSDKGLLSHQDKLWAQLAADKLALLQIPVIFSVNAIQQVAYAGYFGEEHLVADHTSLDFRGPLLGVLSAHLLSPRHDLFVLACDLLLMENRLLNQLSEAYLAAEAFDAYIFTRNGQQEPLCGIYTAKGLKSIWHLLQTHQLTKHSMKFVLSKLQVCEIAVEDNDDRFFGNFNSHAEINGL
ncbi:hypothetical protein DBR40_11800 [Pedobacter sp. KBW01]|uniref:molybdenum cofactor guanylyltransferase n=1 Tax=Pedobacter sp. KBW01 TaxID=2153364 RepID=UPI000F5959ED|nr:molybdenum cofactor guanylyltransferase [Pedobacter sp. KBW01]RQO76576.1 hypothetical protein DBR40_11800 [Pedobacter sp. KBW01]